LVVSLGGFFLYFSQNIIIIILTKGLEEGLVELSHGLRGGRTTPKRPGKARPPPLPAFYIFFKKYFFSFFLEKYKKAYSTKNRF
jgi:hypothetical protein